MSCRSWDYYTERGAWVAVVNRVEGMLRDYPDTQATRDALPLMENAYRQMQMSAQAEKVAKIIAAGKQQHMNGNLERKTAASVAAVLYFISCETEAV